MDEVKIYAPQNLPMLLVGAKADLEAHRSVQYDIAKEFADIHKMKYIETSAKTGTGVEEAFVGLAESMIHKE